MTWECVFTFLNCPYFLRLEVLPLVAPAEAYLQPKGTWKLVCHIGKSAVGLPEYELMVLLQPSQPKWLGVQACVQTLAV